MASAGLSCLFFAAAADAAAESIVAPAGAGQPALAVEVTAGGLVARTCAAAAGCAATGGVAIAAEGLEAGGLAGAKLSIVALRGGKHVVRVDVDGASPGTGWVMLLAASAKEPVVVWQGVIGAGKSEHGEGRSKIVFEEKGEKGSRLVVGDRYENATICGRPAVLGARELDPTTLELQKGASVQSLSAEERAKAIPIHATRLEGEKPPPIAPLLRATAASSAVDKKMSALTDGDPETTWSEDRAGVGRGEFVSMSSAEEVPITWIELRVRPEKADVEGGVAPKSLFLATPDRLFEVTLPEDAWQKPGARYEVKLPVELRTSCLAVVLDEAYGRGDPKAARTTLAEVAAHTPFDGGSLEGLVGALGGGGDRAKGAAALLARAGSPAIAATIAGYGKLDDVGKSLAREVVDGAPCTDQVPFFAPLMIPLDDKGRPRAVGPTDGEALHARDRIRRCGRVAAPTLARLVAEAPAATKAIVAREMALVAPADAIAPIVDALSGAPDATRRELRAALAQAARSERASEALAVELASEKLAGRSELTRVDLLRAAGPVLAKIPGGREAFGAAAVKSAAFRTRFLVLAPAAELARAGDANALGYLGAALRRDEDPHVRARAAEVAARVPALIGELAAAAGDPEVRVREAAVAAIGKIAAEEARAASSAEAAVAERLSKDAWTFVRAAAALALGALPASVSADSALAAALADISPEVRAVALDGLGAHRASAHRDAVHALAAAPEQPLDVRARAIVALGALCDARWLDDWSKLALRLGSPQSDADQRMGSAALQALGALHPADLARRLEPLTRADAPRGVRELVKSLELASGSCK